VEKFDPELGFKFRPMLHGGFARPSAAPSRSSAHIRIPVHMSKGINPARFASSAARSGLGREPTSEEIALEMDLLAPEDVQPINASYAKHQELEPALPVDSSGHRQVRRIVRVPRNLCPWRCGWE